MTEPEKQGSDQKIGMAPVGETTGVLCATCNQAIAQPDVFYINDKPVCENCRKKLAMELQMQRVKGADIVTGLLGGGLAAIVAAVIWAGLVILTGYEVGYVAIGVGALAGYGVYLAAGRKRGVTLQIIAAVVGITGILIGKYIAFYYFLKQYITEHGSEFSEDALTQISLFSFNLVSLFITSIQEWFSGYDILWVILAVYTAYRIPRVLKIKFSGQKKRELG
ncbi:MAG: hypothetical protein AAB019_08155 [Planctomycetota bacterium]